MSQENVEAFNRALEAGNRRDLDAMMRELHAEVEWHAGFASQLTGEATVYRGSEGVREGLMRDIFASFDELRFESSEIRDLGDRVLSIGFMHARGTESGVEIESPWAYLVRFEDGKAIWIGAYTDVGQALEAAGLSE
jgi:ketosteroid isomerase-like protein